MSNGRRASDVMQILVEKKELQTQAYKNSKPEQPCPCGSGLNYQACHGYVDPSRDVVGVYFSTNGYIPPYGEDKMPGFIRRAARMLAGG